MSMWLLAVVLFIIASSIAALVVAIVSSVKHGVMHYFFALFLASAVVWIAAIAAFLLTKYPQLALFSATMFYIAGACIVYALFMLSVTMPSQRDQRVSLRKWIPYLSALPALVVVILPLLGHGPIRGVHMAADLQNTAIINTFGYSIYFAIFLLYSLTAGCVMIYKWRHASGKNYKRQLAYMTGSALFGVAFGAIFNLLLPLLGNYHLIWVGPLCGIPVVIVIAYAMLRYSLFDARAAVIRMVVYFMVLVTMVGLYATSSFLLSNLLHQSAMDPTVVGINGASVVILALLFQSVKQFFDHLTNQIFYHGDYNTDDFFERINSELNATTDLRSLLQRAATEISTTIQAKQGFFFVRYDDRFMMAGSPHHSRIILNDVDILDRYVVECGLDAIVTDILPNDSAVGDVLRKYHVGVALPLHLSNGALCYLFLGPRRNHHYNQRDIRLLETISDELVIAIQNALSIQDVEEINQTLQQRIEDATKELRASNAQLQRLDAAKDEFISMASHQLRTPLTSVKGYISMVLEGDVGKITDMQHKLLSEAFISSERMVHLINDFLNVSRLQTGKFMIERRAVDLAKITKQEVEGLQAIAKSHNLKLKFKAGPRIPVLYVDESKIRQVIMNFVDNAIYYSREFTTITIDLSIEEGDALLRVHDTGIGVPEAEQAHLFTKFFRATNARKQRPDGTGVGLFLAKKVIVAHGGHIVFSSVEGEGSVFGFRLPIKKLSLAPASDVDNLEHQ